MNAKEYIEEVMLRLSRFDVISQLNEPLILTYINKGRQQSQRFSLEVMPERYARVSNLTISSIFVPAYTVTSYAGKTTRMYPVALPNDFIDAYRVILRYTLNGIAREVDARYYSLEELYQSNILAINPPMLFSPLYTIIANNDSSYRLLIAGLDIMSNTSIFASSNYSNINCEIWYTAAIGELEYRTSANGIDNELTLPVTLEELAVNYAMLHCLRHVRHQEGIELLMKEIRLLESLFTQNYDKGIEVKDVELAAYEG